MNRQVTYSTRQDCWGRNKVVSKAAHMLDSKDVHAIDLETWNIVSSGEICAALGPTPVCSSHTCTQKRRLQYYSLGLEHGRR